MTLTRIHAELIAIREALERLSPPPPGGRAV
jgi:hypothetical protein